VKPTSQDEHEGNRLAILSLILATTTFVCTIVGTLATVVAVIGAGLFGSNSWPSRIPVWNGQGWFPGWPTWAATLAIVGACLLITGSIGMYLMRRLTRRIREVTKRIKSAGAVK